jgi:tRNA threonylcarbamoyladenosine biosynthesis protein TsaE
VSSEEKENQLILNGPVVPRISLTVSTAARMRELGRRLASVLRAGDLVILSGGLGTGKTTLTKGIGDGLGVRGPITSPTFVIARVHPPVAGAHAAGASGGGVSGGGVSGGGSAGLWLTGWRPGPALVHVDAYRLGSALELDDLDLDTDVASAVTVVEWGEGLAEGLSADRLEITITLVAAGDAGMADAVDGNGPTGEHNAD